MVERYWLRLLHLVSPSLPTGAFAYSQGLEWAVEQGWIQDGPGLGTWLSDLVENNMTYVDIPLLARMFQACRKGSDGELARLCQWLLALRETHELRLEEKHRGRAMVSLLEGLQLPVSNHTKTTVMQCQLAGFALVASCWDIPLPQAAMGYVWSWLENQVLAGIKIIPLGQTEGQTILSRLDPLVMDSVTRGLQIREEEIGASNPALAIACSLHETQYTRLYRS